MLKSRYSASPCSVKSDRYFGTSALKIRSFCAALNGGSDNIKRPITACCAKRANVMASFFPHPSSRNKLVRYARRISSTRATILRTAGSENEIIAGGNDKHMDFRVSVLKINEGGASKIVLTTVVNTHNSFGKAYMSLIAPFHRFGVRTIMSNAVAANRV